MFKKCTFEDVDHAKWIKATIISRSQNRHISIVLKSVLLRPCKIWIKALFIKYCSISQKGHFREGKASQNMNESLKSKSIFCVLIALNTQNYDNNKYSKLGPDHPNLG